MECVPVAKLTEGPEWVYEIKLDGYRAIAVKGQAVNLFSRRRKSFNRQCPHIVEALSGLPEGTVLDGEVVAQDDSGKPNFNLLQHSRSQSKSLSCDGLLIRTVFSRNHAPAMEFQLPRLSTGNRRLRCQPFGAMAGCVDLRPSTGTGPTPIQSLESIHHTPEILADRQIATGTIPSTYAGRSLGGRPRKANHCAAARLISWHRCGRSCCLLSTGQSFVDRKPRPS